jgi:hypothetical protein
MYHDIAMAGNIIPAIATTNAIIAGLVVMKTFGVLRGEIKDNQRVSCFMFFMSICTYTHDHYYYYD